MWRVCQYSVATRRLNAKQWCCLFLYLVILSSVWVSDLEPSDIADDSSRLNHRTVKLMNVEYAVQNNSHRS